MPGTGLGPPSGFGTSAQRALITGGLALAVVVVLTALVNRGAQSGSFANPIIVDAVVVEQGMANSGGATRLRCRPVYRFDWQDGVRTASPSTQDAASCVVEGSTVRIVVDAADPTRVADPAAERSVSRALLIAAIVAAVMIVVGTIIAWKRRRSPE